MKLRHRGGSLRLRLLGVTLVTLILALTGAQAWLTSLFRDHVLQQFDADLSRHLDQLTARLDFDAEGLPIIDPRGMSDPRWEKPYAGLYWQIERHVDDPAQPRSVLRSRSLWDVELALPADALADGVVHRHDIAGPGRGVLRAVERSLKVSEPSGPRWRLIVAGDLRDAATAVERFTGVLTASLVGLGLLLVLAALAQVAIGLAPLKTMQQGLQSVREGRRQRLEGRFPTELQPLIDGFNRVLDRNAEVVERARAQAGNLAHALKTPLAILGQAASKADASEFSELVREQVRIAEHQMHWHLARTRVAAMQQVPGQRAPLESVLARLLRTMDKLHADRHLDLGVEGVSAELEFAGEAQDLQEMLGNLLDNACRSASAVVRVRATREGPWLRIDIDDDGPGIAPDKRAAVLRRGVRLDENREGSGLGLAIVVDLARLYGGDLELTSAAAGGLSARLSLPAAG